MRWPWRLVQVRGPSMVPTLRDGDVVVARWAPGEARLRVGDVVLVALPDRPLGVKRVVRLEPAARDRASVWVEGDNPFGTTDSRVFGALPAAAVSGRVLGRLWPRPGRIPPRTAQSDQPDGPDGPTSPSGQHA